MKHGTWIAAIAIGLTASLAAAPAGVQAATPAKPAAKAAKAATPPAGVVEPESLAALDKMSTFLGTLQSIDVTSQTSRDLVTNDGERLQIDGTAHYKVRRPNGFVIETVSPLRKRKYIYDGKQFTIFAPEMGFYSTVPAPPTNAQVLDVLWDKFGIQLPLEDLFRWNDPAEHRREKVQSGFDVGPATIDGVDTEQYAFRQDKVDWQIWIQKGDQPLPRKLVIIDRSDPANPAYSARLTWNLNPTVTAADFTFQPPADAKSIRLTASR